MTLRSRSQPSATVRNRLCDPRMAVPVGSSAEPLRKRLRRPQETITRQQGAHQQPGGKDFPLQAVSVANQESKRYQYTCPFCTVAVASTVKTGQVDHRHACGNEFRVHAGVVSGRVHKHACPRCGTIVLSSAASRTNSSKTQNPCWQDLQPRKMANPSVMICTVKRS